MGEAWIIDSCRTPRGIGKAGKGALAHLHPHHLGATVLRALTERNEFDTEDVDDIVWGTSNQKGKQASNLGRMAALLAGYDIRSSAVTLDRFCGSGITTVSIAGASIMSGMEDLCIAGGTEMMSSYGDVPAGSPFLDCDDLALREVHPQTHQGLCADAIATLEGMDRTVVDELAVVSQARAKRAMEEGRFDRSLVPVHNADGSVALAAEEFPRPSTTLDTLADLAPSFEQVAQYPLDEAGTTFMSVLHRKYEDLQVNHVHHAGNSSGVVDGAAAILMASPEYAKSHGLKPRAKIVAMANMGDCPTLMLNAPVPAARKALAKAGMSVNDIDLFEINEAFAVVAEKFMRDLDLDREKVNVNGGAIALGHPIGATGSILIGTVLDELERADKQFGLVTMCAAGGMAPAIIIERL